jgi:virginiamycin B lyase
VVTPAVAAALALPPDFRSRIERAGMLIRQVGAEGGFAYHPLLREFLLERLGADRGEDEQRRLHGLVAPAIAGDGDQIEAIEHLLAARSWTEAVSAIEREGPGLLRKSAGLAAPAQAYVPWSDDSDNTIARATLDGVQVQQSFIQGVSNPGQVVVDASHIYWFNRGDGAIGRANIDGSGVNADFIPGAAAVGSGLAVGDGYIFWTDFQNSTLGRANVDGSAAGTIVTGLMSPRGVAVDASHVYWTNYGVENGQLPIGRANLDGTEAVNDFILAPSPGTGQIGQMVADSSHLYWGHGPAIARASSDGMNINTGFAVAPGGNAGLAVDGSHVYWSTNGDFFYDAHPIARANLDGSGVNPVFIDNQPLVGGIAVDGLAPPPSSGGTTTTGTIGTTGTTGDPGISVGASTAPQSRGRCVVPRLKGKTLGDAHRALTRAHCGLGKVNRPRPAHGRGTGTRRSLVVKSESLRAGTKRPAGTSVSLTLAYKTLTAARPGANK